MCLLCVPFFVICSCVQVCSHLCACRMHSAYMTCAEIRDTNTRHRTLMGATSAMRTAYAPTGGCWRCVCAASMLCFLLQWSLLGYQG